VFTDAVGQHQFKLEAGQVKSHYLNHYTRNINHRGGVLLACQTGFGLLTDNEDEVSFFTLYSFLYYLFMLFCFDSCAMDTALHTDCM